MAKRITVEQLARAFQSAPGEVKKEGQIFLQRGLSEYKRVALQSTPWRVGGSGGGIPKETGNLRERHRTIINGLEGRFGVPDSAVRYAKYVHGDKPYAVKVRGKNIETRPWLEYARTKANNAVEKHYRVFMDNVLKFIAT